MAGKILDERYELMEKIGSGGMADVYKARDILLDRIVAVKILHGNFVEDNDFIVRFRHEAQSAGKLSHPNIVGIYDVGCDDDIHYIVMEYVEGETLKQYILNHPNIPIDTAVRIAIEIGYALEEAHANGIIHCDVKPHNVLLTKNGKVKVTDFGIARAINSSTVMDKESILGSVHYLSPEQAAGDKITEKTDIYSLGIVLYEMLTHHLPFEGETAVSIALQHMQGDISRPTKYNPAISPMLEECLLTALQKDPDKRYDSVSDFVSELKIAQGFTTTMYKPASHDFTAMTRPIPQKAIHRKEPVKESRFTTFITNLPQKYIWIGMVILFIVCFAWAFFSFGNFWSSEDISVPNVVGKPVEVAETTLKKMDLKVSVDEIASDDVPSGQVISQTPSAGTNVKAKRIIHLTVSKGGASILIPDLKGLTLEQAKERLDKLGLSLGAIENGNDPDKPSEIIISQSPEPGSKAAKGTRVNITVNMKQKISIPNVVGMTLADARKTLLTMKLSVGTIHSTDGVTADDSSALVVSQDPAGGESSSNNVVNLTIGGKKKPQAKSGTVNISIPKGGNARQVEIYVSDDGGKRTVYKGKAAPGSTVSKDVSGNGTVHVQVVIDGSVVQDREL
ncbi:Stk1 family PASTA domain-containing Ser/Thr kinase [Dialister sp.]|uniref:Stk1 family PASTA domain-containing Ser/Thr kinase n=1 Tax=Dialister sp. TaxID=1955814 RepID=UPI002E811B7F|nr:Stk1 family PASTA domain-containing Ser/Thr kinase [Dialister sp.]MEE3452030.1 Stk1 family PASTA domain-containing Ser/Thr kinase [Dialister sp.]